MDQIILSVGLVKPKPGIFKDYVQFLLILATPVEVQIVAVVFDQGELSLLPTNYSISTDGVNMLNICGSSNGRIFLCGGDGHLYEMLYESKGGFFKRKVRKLNHTQNFFGNLMPSFLKWSNDEPIIDISIDTSRKYLYTLSESSVIDVWYLGSSGDEMIKITTYSDGFKDAQRSLSVDISDSVPLLNKQNFKLISITAIPNRSAESEFVLIAISKQGHQFFFSASMIGDKFSNLYVKSVHYSPLRKSQNAAPNPNGSNVVTEIHESFYSNGVFLLADAMTEEKDRLITILRETSRNGQFSKVFETVQEFDVQGKTLAVAERPLKLQVSFGSEIELTRQYNELTTQHYHPPREFICLSNTGIQIITKRRPVDLLKIILQDSSNDSQDLINNFFQQYGKDEGCYMALLIACANEEFDHSTGISGSEIIRKASDIFFAMGGEPTLSRSISGYTQPGSSIPITSNIIYSSSHNALMLYFSRIIGPIWFSPIVNGREATIEGNKKFEITNVRYQNNELIFLKNKLKGLDKFLKNNSSLYDFESSSYKQKSQFGDRQGLLLQNNKQVDDARRFQQDTIKLLFNANKRSIQILTFLEILNRFSLVNYLRGVNEKILKLLHSLEFNHFVWKQDSGMMKDLIRLIIRKSDNEDGVVDVLFRQLETDCPNFFTAADIKECEGFEKLNLAKKIHDEDNSKIIRHKALEAFLDAVRYAGSSRGHIDIAPVCRQFRKLGDYSSAIKLALQSALIIDPNNLAYDIIISPQNENAAVREAYEKRSNCYNAALETLQELYNPEPLRESSKQSLKELPRKKLSGQERILERNKIIAEMTKSNDQLFHLQLFEWYIQNRKNNIDELLNLRSPYLEDYLRNKYPNSNILAKFYDYHEKWNQAAEVLSQMADTTEEDVPLDTRIAYLTKAISSLKLSNSTGTSLQNRLDVALVQKSVLSHLKQAFSSQNLVKEKEDYELAIKELDSQLKSLTELYNKYTVPFRLFEASLEVLQCSDYNIMQPIYHLWVQIVVGCISKYEDPQRSKIELLSKISTLAKKYYPSKYFPVDFIISMIEKLSFRLNIEPGWLCKSLLDPHIIIPYDVLYSAYKRIHLFLVNREEYPIPYDIDPKYFLLTPSDDSRRHIIATLLFILEKWIESSSKNEDIFLSHEIYSSDLGMLESDTKRLGQDSSQNFSNDALLSKLSKLKKL